MNFQIPSGKGRGVLTYISQNSHRLLIYTKYFYYKNTCCILQPHTRTALGHLSQIYVEDWVKTLYVPEEILKPKYFFKWKRDFKI